MSVLPHVDPLRRRGPLAKAWLRLGATPFGRWYGINVATRLDPVLMRRTHGRARVSLGLPTATLTTTGARSGVLRTNPVLYFHDGADVVLIASSFGRERHPAWLHNLRANPACRLGRDGPGQRFVAHEVADTGERDRLYALAARIYPAFDDYERRTAASGRRIAVLRLSPAGERV